MYPGTFNLDDKTRRDELLGSVFSEETYTYFIREHIRVGFRNAGWYSSSSPGTITYPKGQHCSFYES